MKALKEPLARMANKEDGCSGTFWQGRFKSIAITDDEQLLATCAYIDLNPVAAGVAKTPETSRHTSVRQRVANVRQKGKIQQLKKSKTESFSDRKRLLGNVEQNHWLIPIENRKAKSAEAREGMIEGLTLSCYLQIVDYTSRVFREGKARVSKSLANILDRLGTSAEFWSDHLQELLKTDSPRGKRLPKKEVLLAST